jgi:hypothetical protein
VVAISRSPDPKILAIINPIWDNSRCYRTHPALQGVFASKIQISKTSRAKSI